MSTPKPRRPRSRPAPLAWVALGLAFAGIAAGVVASLWIQGVPAPVRWASIAGAVLSTLGALGLWRAATRAALPSAGAEELEALRASLEAEFEELMLRLDRREREVAERLVAFHAETEFPYGLDLVDRDLDDDQLAALARKDRRVVQLLEDEASLVFDRIRADAYSEDGVVQPARIRDEALDLARRVARIYRPDSDDALLDTSVAEIAKAASRACLHLLVVLDGLPLDLKEQSIQTMYAHVRRGVKTYETYKAASPYLEYATHATRVGRWMLGTNPLYLGSSWLLTTLARKGAESVGGKYLRRQGVFLLRDLIGLFGFEVAAVYGRSFRYRDANWFYGAELTELLAGSGASREDLRHALAEVAALRLRNEYDRVYLFRLLASERSARPGRFRAQAVLSRTERRSVAERLARFARSSSVLDPGSRRWSGWAEGVAERLGTSPPEGARPPAESSEDGRRLEAATSLAALMLDVLGAEPVELPERLVATRTLQALAPAERARLLEALHADPPYFFAAPQVYLGTDLARDYVDDLIDLVASCDFPWRTHELVLEVAAETGLERADVRRRLEQAYARALARRGAARRLGAARIEPEHARAVLGLLRPDETIARIVPDARLGTAPDAEPVVVVATDRRLFACALRPEPVVAWTAQPGHRASRPERRLLHVDPPPAEAGRSRLVVRGSPKVLRDLAARVDGSV